ncbi:hypothetical protein F511_30101 [Dorcoceras hygrometricum]|uniref:Uncharacterized protein n=1 Tax=Dorcoceras hygrometricum TaxID=472368 RepID=A0A2Z7CY90_9LAMI|nr:hypothetical protein F511_30101 [Dorcoceras hygrometricum]
MARPVYQLATQIKPLYHSQPISRWKSSVRDHRGPSPVSPSQLGGRHSNPVVTTPTIALDFAGTTQQSASHNVAPNQIPPGSNHAAGHFLEAEIQKLTLAEERTHRLSSKASKSSSYAFPPPAHFNFSNGSNFNLQNQNQQLSLRHADLIYADSKFTSTSYSNLLLPVSPKINATLTNSAGTSKIRGFLSSSTFEISSAVDIQLYLMLTSSLLLIASSSRHADVIVADSRFLPISNADVIVAAHSFLQ